MNNTRRMKIRALLETLEGVQNILQEILEEEEESRDNIPESLHGSEMYERAEEVCDTLSDADDALTEAIDCLTETIE